MSTATSITFNSFSLQSSTYRTENIVYRHLASKVIDSKPEPRRGGFDIIDTFYSQKEIRITGWILSDSKENLRIAIDNLKKALVPEEKSLDIGYGDDIIRHTATVRDMSVEEEHHHITRIPYEIIFLTLPWGTDSNSIEVTESITTSPFNDSIVIEGSYGPFPILRWTVVGTPSAAVTELSFQNNTTGDEIDVTNLSLAANGNYLEVDTNEMTVKENGTNIDFDGVFPSFDTSTNSYTVTITGSGFTLNQSITYYPTYL